LTRFSAAHKRTSSLPVNKTKVRTEKPAWDSKARALLTNFLGLLTDAKTTVQETLRAAKEFLRGTKGMNPPGKQVAAEEVKKCSPETKAIVAKRVIVILNDDAVKDGPVKDLFVTLEAATQEPAPPPAKPAPSQTKPIAPPQPFPSDQPSYFQGLGTSVATPYGAPPAPSSLSVSKLPETLSFDEQCTQAIKICFDACPKDREKATEKFEEFREITRAQYAIGEAAIRSWIKAGLVGCSTDDLVAIHEWADGLPRQVSGWLAGIVSKLVMNKLDGVVKKRLGEVFVRAAWRGEIDGMKAAANRLDRHCCAEALRDNSESPGHVAQKIRRILERELEDNPIPQGQ
jgi:hypothetical protein